MVDAADGDRMKVMQLEKRGKLRQFQMKWCDFYLKAHKLIDEACVCWPWKI